MLLRTCMLSVSCRIGASTRAIGSLRDRRLSRYAWKAGIALTLPLRDRTERSSEDWHRFKCTLEVLGGHLQRL